MASIACAAVICLEAIGSLVMWAALPLGWFWVGARVYELTGSVAADLGVIFLGFVASTILAMSALARLDGVWIGLRRRGGHEQTDGALSRVVIVTATLGIVAFLIWAYLIAQAFVMPFMPTE